MKVFQSVIIKAVCSIVIGVLLVAYPDKTTEWIVILIGLLFLVPGIVSILGYFKINHSIPSVKPFFPIVGIGSFICGIILVVAPEFFVRFLMYILGFFLILAGGNSLVILNRLRRSVRIAGFLYIIPIVVLLSGFFILFNPIASASIPFIIMGISSILYGISEFINAFKFRKSNQKEHFVEIKEVE